MRSSSTMPPSSPSSPWDWPSPSLRRPTHHDAMSLGVWLLFQLVARALTHIHDNAMPPPIGLPIGEGGTREGRAGRRPTDRGPLTIPSSPHRSSFVHPFVVRVGRGPILFQLSSLFLPPFLSRMQSPNGRGRLPLVAAAWSEPILPCPPGSLESSDAPCTPRPSRLDLQGDHQHRRVVIRPREQRFPSIPLFICPRFSVSRPS